MKQNDFKSGLPGVMYGDYYGGEEELPPIVKFATTCCAMCILSIKNFHTKEEIQDVIKSIKKKSLSRKWNPADRSGGERNIMVVTTPGEDKLEQNLIDLNFQCINKTMKRRVGYPGGELKTYLLTF